MKTHLLRHVLALTICMLGQAVLYGNNIQVTNVSLTGQNTTSHFTMVKFDISWENSWRVVGGPANWDAAWVFVKYRVGAGPWLHAWINDDGHISPTGSVIEVGLLDPGGQFDPENNPGMGVFIHRSGPGSGTFSLTNVQLRWNYGDNGLADNEQVDIKVFAIEHVYVPQAPFFIGSGGTESGHFYKYNPLQEPYRVDNDGAIPVGTQNDNLFYDNTSGSSGDQLGPIPAAFPEGFKAFYIMKYELSQQGYVDFLNTLDRNQQAGVVNAPILGSGPYSTYVMSVSATPTARNAIRIQNNAPGPPSPLNFFCDLNNNGIPYENADGQNLACNYISVPFLTSYLDWAGLRPYTELEYEKAGRGFMNPVPFEFAWGSTMISYIQYLDNPGAADENPDPFANCNSNLSNIGPVRCGSFARLNSGREMAGSGFYGVAELSGNLWELIITVGSPQGRAFTGLHGDGLLTSNGRADVFAWPDPVTYDGIGIRGGGYEAINELVMLSCRLYASSVAGSIINGLRGGRSVAP